MTALVIAALADTSFESTGARSQVGSLSDGSKPDINILGEALFTRYVFAFEITSVLLVIAVVGAVLLARQGRRTEEIVDPGQAERQEELSERIAAAEAKAEGHRPPPHQHFHGNGDDDGGAEDDAESDSEVRV